jgi:hypothetical protein
MWFTRAPNASGLFGIVLEMLSVGIVNPISLDEVNQRPQLTSVESGAAVGNRLTITGEDAVWGPPQRFRSSTAPHNEKIDADRLVQPDRVDNKYFSLEFRSRLKKRGQV